MGSPFTPVSLKLGKRRVRQGCAMEEKIPRSPSNNKTVVALPLLLL